MFVSIVGNGGDKFTSIGEKRARDMINLLLISYQTSADIFEKGDLTIRSGHCIRGGIDIWTEEEATKRGIKMDIKQPKTFDGKLEDATHLSSWSAPYGYKARNLDLATSNFVDIIVADAYPPNFPENERESECFHCKKAGREFKNHVRSGACWTGNEAIRKGNQARWYIIPNGDNDQWLSQTPLSF